MRISYGNFQQKFVSPAHPIPVIVMGFSYGDFIWGFLMRICNGESFMVLRFSPNPKLCSAQTIKIVLNIMI
jgi:hypothetical protein